MMKKLITILSLLCCAASVPLAGWGQANLPFSPNALPVQGPDPTGLQGYPIAVVGAPGGTNVNVNVAAGVIAGAGIKSIVNSTVLPLAGEASFTGAFESVLPYSSLEIDVYTDKPTHTGGVSLQWSSDGSTVEYTDTFTILNTVGTVIDNKQSYAFVVRGAYFRIVYANGSAAQTFFHLTTVYRPFAREASLSHGFNGQKWQPIPSTQQIFLVNTGTYTTSQSSANIVNYGQKYAVIELNVFTVPAAPGAGGLDLQFIQQDIAGQMIRLNLAGAKITAVGTYVWIVGPGCSAQSIAPAVRQVLGLPLPAKWSATVQAFDAQAYNYSLTCDLIP